MFKTCQLHKCWNVSSTLLAILPISHTPNLYNGLWHCYNILQVLSFFWGEKILSQIIQLEPYWILDFLTKHFWWVLGKGWILNTKNIDFERLSYLRWVPTYIATYILFSPSIFFLMNKITLCNGLYKNWVPNSRSSEMFTL